jgi:predicted XRE-type DNA-binding protein
MSKPSGTAIRRGSANVFADLGFPDPETHLLKAQLVSRVHDILRARALSQTEAARIMGVSQPDVSRMLKGEFRDFSVERIMKLLTRLGCAVDIVVRPSDKSTEVVPIRLEPAD